MMKNTDSSPSEKSHKRKSDGDDGPSLPKVTVKYKSQEEDKNEKNNTNENASVAVDDEADEESPIKIDSKSAFNGLTSSYKFTIDSPKSTISNVDKFLDSVKKWVCEIFCKALGEIGTIRAIFDLQSIFLDDVYNPFDITHTVFVRDVEKVDSYFELARSDIISKFNKYTSDTVEDAKLSYLDLHIHETRDCNTFMSPPDHIRPYIVNIDSADNMSFKWAVLAALHDAEIYKPTVNILQKYSNELRLDAIEFPVTLDDLSRIEELNNISFNIFVLKYSYETKKDEIEGPVRHTERRREKHINLLLIYDENKSHYCYIKDLCRLVDSTKTGHICDGCLCFFSNTNSLQEHQQFDCLRVKTVMASHVEKFDKTSKNIPVPIVVYADFEALLEPIKKINIKNRETYTVNVKKHVPYSFGFYIKCRTDNSLSRVKYFTGKEEGECEFNFLKMLKDSLEDILRSLGKKTCDYVPVFFHNLSNYDGHFVIKSIYSEPGKVSVLGNKHSFIAIHKNIKVGGNEIQLRILDSLNFLKDSLDSLVKNLNRNQFHESRQRWKDVDDDLFTLLTQKGVFPYDYIASFADLQKTVPEKIHFYDSLKGRHISDDDYKRVLQVWEKFNCKTILEYALLYLKVDVLLLADVLENVRNICLDTYQIDPAHYYSISGVSWDAMLKVTNIELESLPEVDMLLFLKKGIRGGIAQCTQRHAVANNKYLPSTYNSSQNSSYLMYYDANNLYGWAMSQPLPYGGFEWVAVGDFNVKDVSTDSNVGYFLEVDLEYPNNDKELHDWHADYPFCPEKKIVHGVTGKRLINDFKSKIKYVLHHSILVQCLNYGLKLQKIHRILKFKQKRWLKPFVDLNIERRANALTASEKDFYKQMINSIYGRSIMDIEKYVGVKILNQWPGDKYKQGGNFNIGKPEYHSHIITSNNLITVQEHKTKLQYKLPVYIGYAVLDLSKFHMYEFHYGFMKKKFGKNIKLIYTDTDSFIYQIFTKDYYDDMRACLSDHFDTSNYPEDNQFGYPLVNNMKVGFFKDECKGTVVKEFVALRPKVYFIDAGENSKKVAASARVVIKDQLTIEDYKQCLYGKEPLFKEMYYIQADGHDLFTKRERKAVLQPAADFKRHWLENGIDSLPFGHYRLSEGHKTGEKVDNVTHLV